VSVCAAATVVVNGMEPLRRKSSRRVLLQGLIVAAAASFLPRRLTTKGRTNMQTSPAVKVALAHIEAWSHHDWNATRAMLAPDVHALITSTQRAIGTSELTGIDKYMALKTRAASLVEPESVQVLAAVGDENTALILATFRIAMGPHGSFVTMARSCLYSLDEHKKIRDERDSFFVLSEAAGEKE
jgi:SnoaL-like domain